VDLPAIATTRAIVANGLAIGGILSLEMEHARDTTAQLDALMAEIGWVRRLARALVKDAAVAADVAQDAWLLAMQHPPTDARPLRPWLHRVVLNVVRMRHRAMRRRDAREAAIESRDVATPAELVERIELQRAVADEVLALTEPYRTTVLLRFVEGLTSGQIARRLGVPEGTVRRRLKVAIDQLRKRLQARSDGPKHGWLATLIPFARGPAPKLTAAATLGALAMKKLLGGLVVLVMLLLIGAAVWWRHHDRRGESSGAVIAYQHGAGQSQDGHDPQRTAIIPSWIPQIGVAGRRIAGRVTFAGDPVDGAIVRLALVSTPAVQPIAEVRSTADGAFDFGVQPAAVFEVSAEAPRRTASFTMIAVADLRAKPDQIVLQLGDCRSRLYGSVLDASGGSIAKARILTTDFGGIESDATGQYSLCLPEGESQVRVEADGYGTITSPFRLFGEFHYNLVLVPEAVLIGQVITVEHTPVAGAQVIASPDNLGDLHHVATRWTTADRDGRFQLTGLAPGNFQVSAFAEGLGTTMVQLAVARPAAPSHELRLVIEDLAQVRGRVVMAGQPVSGARISTTHNGVPSRVASFSQADGSFVLSGVAFGTTRFVAEPYAVRSPKALAITRARVDDLVLEVSALATLHGHVTRKGQPVAGAEIGCEQCVFSTKSDSSGAFALEGIPAGDQQIFARSFGVRAVAEEKAVTLAAGDDKALDIELDGAGRAKGTVIDEDGKPVPNVYVHLSFLSGIGDQGESMTDGKGTFDCGPMLGGDYLPTVYPSPMTEWAFAPAISDQLASVRVPRDGVVTGIKLAIKHERLAIRGKVVDDLGAAVSDVHIEAVSRVRYGLELPSAMSDATGHFEIGDLARGTYSLRAHGADGSGTEGFDVLAGAGAVTITLARPGAIEGTLTGFSSSPLVEACTRGTDQQYTLVRAIVEGDRFSVSSLPPGHYTVHAKAGSEVDEQLVEVRPGETIRLTLHGRGLGKVEGRVTEYGSKSPIAGMRCDANLSIDGEMPMDGELGLSPIDPAFQAFTDANGHFSVSAPIGRVRVVCFAPNTDLSPAGMDVDATSTSIPTVELVAVRVTSFVSRGNPGFRIARDVLPITVDRIELGGPAASTRLAVGDHIVAIDGTTLQGMLSMGAMVLLGNHQPGMATTVGIERGGVVQTIKIVVGSYKH